MTSNIAKRMAGLSWTVLLLPPLFVPHQALADSGVGVDTWLANILDPTGGLLSQPCDPDGTSWVAPLQRRSPTGNLYDCPPEAPLLRDLSAEWRAYGILSFGYVHAGDDRTALYNRYSDWRGDNPVLGLLDLHVENPYTGEYVEVRGSHISDDDQYYQAVYGEAGAFKIQAFIRDMPNILSTDARPIWNGVGTNALTLPASLLAGRSTPGEVGAGAAGPPGANMRGGGGRGAHAGADLAGGSQEGGAGCQRLAHPGVDGLSGPDARGAPGRAALRRRLWHRLAAELGRGGRECQAHR
jgi:hypothetical protein